MKKYIVKLDKKEREKEVQPLKEPNVLLKGREESYFFPNERITITAFSYEEAIKKLK